MPNGNQSQAIPSQREIDLGNIGSFEALRYASIFANGDRGKEGQMYAWYAAEHSLLNGVGLEGITDSYRAQIANAIQNGGGLNVNANLLHYIGRNNTIFGESMGRLQVRDVVEFLRQRIDADTILNGAYANKTFDELKAMRTPKARAYFDYLDSRINTGVKKKISPLVLEREAEEGNLGYSADVAEINAREQHGQNRGRGPRRR